MKKITGDPKALRRHRRVILIALLWAILLILACKFAFGQSLIAESTVAKITGSYIDNRKNHALVVGMVKGNEVQFFSYGENETGSAVKPTAQTVFGIGTVSSVFTTSLLSLFAERNMVSLTDPLQQYFPRDVHIPSYQPVVCHPRKNADDLPALLNCYPDPLFHPVEIVLCDLSTHSSGMPELPYNLHTGKRDGYARYSDNDLYRFLNTHNPEIPSGVRYQFSPLGISLIGNGLAWKFNEDYERLLQTYLLFPLQLSNTFITGTKEQQLKQIAGHHKDKVYSNDSGYGLMQSALGVHSTAEDLVKFIAAHFNSSDSLIRSALLQTQQSKLQIPPSKRLRDSYGGMGWIISPLSANSEVKRTWQSGVFDGFACYIGFVNESKSGVVILSNSSEPVDGMGNQLLNELNKTMYSTTKSTER